MFMAENFCPKCPLGLNPNFVWDANAKVEGIKYARASMQN
jgi:hypothetical protein